MTATCGKGYWDDRIVAFAVDHEYHRAHCTPRYHEIDVAADGDQSFDLGTVYDPESFFLFWNGALQVQSKFTLVGSILTITGFNLKKHDSLIYFGNES